MTQEPRKATDVLLELESKINVLLGTIQSMDLNIKVLSNKLNEIMKGLDNEQVTSPKITVEAVQTPTVPNKQAVLFGQAPPVDPERSVVITAESKLGMDDSPKGFRRNSRPESYASGDDVYLKREGVPLPSNPASSANRPPPGRSANDMAAPPSALVAPAPKNKAAPPPNTSQVPKELNTHGIVPVEQRVVDRNGKSVFLADVEVVDVSSGEQIFKSRTNGTGKWMAPLPLGNYKVTIRKLESLTREKVESIQTIQVDGTESPLKLPMVIIK
jgi:hypothetical protein